MIFQPHNVQSLGQGQVDGRQGGSSRDPYELTKDPIYATHGPIRLCGILQEEYGKMIKHLDGWPALSSKLPKANNAEANNVDTGIDNRGNW